MKLRALVLPALLGAALLAGCGASPNRVALPAGAKVSNVAAKAVAEDPLPFAVAAKNAYATLAKNPKYKNPRLISIVGRGLDQNGVLVPLLGASWTFRFWTEIEGEVVLTNVIMGVEGTVKIDEDGEYKQAWAKERVLDAEKLAAPTQVVPFAIRLGLKVARGGAAYSYYDVTYNAFYADPAQADANVVDVVSYYRQDQLDGLHIPADAGLLPPVPAPVAPAAPGGTKKQPAKMSSQELVAQKQTRERLPAPVRVSL